MTDHEWVDWVIKKTDEGYYTWKLVEEDEIFGMHYRGKTPREKDLNSSRNRIKEWFFIFKPRPNKSSNAELLVFEDRNRLEELVPAEKKYPKTMEFYEKRYSPANYYDGLGFLIDRQSNSKTYKIEKAILKQIDGE